MRRGELKRRGALRADPAKVRAFQDRSRRASGRARQSYIPPALRAIVRARSLGVCVVCLHREGVDVKCVTLTALNELVERRVVAPIAQLHHVLPKDDAHWPHLALERDNLIGVCADCHYAHEFQPDGRIPRAALPTCALDLAEREALMHYIERAYP